MCPLLLGAGGIWQGRRQSSGPLEAFVLCKHIKEVPVIPTPHRYPSTSCGTRGSLCPGLQGQTKGFHSGKPRASRGSVPKPICPSPADDASFVAAIPSTQVVYFFFEETASEFDFFERLHTSRVARVCKVRGLGGGRG